MNRIINKMKGVTLIEVLAVVIIGVLIIVGAFTLYGKAQAKQAERDTLTAISAIELNIKNAFPNKNYGNLSNTELLKLDAIPKSISVNEDTNPVSLITPTGNNLVVAGSGGGFIIFMENVTTAQCISFSQRKNLGDFVLLASGPTSGDKPTIDESVQGCQGLEPASNGVGFIYDNFSFITPPPPEEDIRI